MTPADLSNQGHKVVNLAVNLEHSLHQTRIPIHIQNWNVVTGPHKVPGASFGVVFLHLISSVFLVLSPFVLLVFFSPKSTILKLNHQ